MNFGLKICQQLGHKPCLGLASYFPESLKILRVRKNNESMNGGTWDVVKSYTLDLLGLSHRPEMPLVMLSEQLMPSPHLPSGQSQFFITKSIDGPFISHGSVQGLQYSSSSNSSTAARRFCTANKCPRCVPRNGTSPSPGTGTGILNVKDKIFMLCMCRGYGRRPSFASVSQASCVLCTLPRTRHLDMQA